MIFRLQRFGESVPFGVCRRRFAEVFLLPAPKTSSGEGPAATAAPRRRQSSEGDIVLALIAITAALRVGIASVGGFGFDEAYMVSNARVLALSYFDHPPLHIWLAGITARLFGSEAPLLLRLPFIALFAGTTWMMFRLTADLFSRRAGLWAALFLNLAPVFTIAHATWVLPDGPLLFFMLASALLVVRIVFAPWPPAHPSLAWIAAGGCGGLACLSKFQGVFLFIGVFAFLLSEPRQRRWLATPGPWLGVAAAVIVFSPVIVWNAGHAWAGFASQPSRLDSFSGVTLRYLGTSAGGQIAYLTPWLIAPLAWCLGGALWRGPVRRESWFLALIAIGPIAVFAAVALFVPSLPHWPMPGWIFTFPLMGDAWVVLEERHPRWVYAGAGAAAAALVAFVGAAEVQVADGAIGRAVPALFKPRDPTLDLLQWDAVAPALAERHLLDADTPAVAGLNWNQASKINVVVGRAIPVLCLCETPQGRSFQHKPDVYVGRNLILIGTTNIISEQHAALAAYFERIEPLAPVIVRRGGEPALELTLLRGVGFKGWPPTAGRP